MTAKRVMLATMAAMALGMLAVPANAQYGGRYYNEDDDYRPRRFERRYEEEEYRPRPRAYGRGSTCVTSRGSCPFPPAPQYTPCKCDIPGFGPKRGAVGLGY